MSTLLATSGHHVGRRFTLGESTRLGRAPDNDIVLADNLVSRYHAQIGRRGLGYEITDLRSKNGVFVNGQAQTEYRLRRGDQVRIGETTLVFEAPQELKTARFTNTLIHLDPEQDETMRVLDRASDTDPRIDQATSLILKLAQVFETDTTDLPDVLNKILRHLLELVGASAGSILLRGRDEEVVPLTAITQGDEMHVNRDAVYTAVGEGKAVLTASLFAPAGQAASRLPRKAMIVPMFDRANVFGAIHLERPEGKDYSLKDISFLQALSRLVSAAVRQAIRIDQLGQGSGAEVGAILGVSKALEAVRAQVLRVAATDSTVLITGETGTGKELVARALHQQSARGGGPFIAINCAAIPQTLIESELFGHERGAFTGADQMKRGKVEMADGGTLFLDEIGEMQIELQPKLLRFLEERIFYRVGGVRPIQTDVRILAATNRDLDEAVRQGRFREDLLFRLKVLPVALPPLRERREDIRVIVEHFAPTLAARVGKPFRGIDPSAWKTLEAYGWPGNVRELLQSLERALIFCDDGLLRTEHFQIPEVPLDRESTAAQLALTDTPTHGRGPERPAHAPPTLADVERAAILRALRFARGSKHRAADLLGIHRNTLRKKIEQYEIQTD